MQLTPKLDRQTAHDFRKISVVIPVYNEQATIKEVVDRVLEVCLGSIEKEIIICDDGSTDGSIEVIERERSAHSEVIRVHVSAINLGKGAAIRFGFKYATGDIIIIQDADLELDPAEYADLIQPILDGHADVVYAVFTQLLGPDGQVWAQFDNQPQAGRYPTSAWVVQTKIVDRYELKLKEGAPPGDYRLLVGMYDLTSGQRLPAVAADGSPLPDNAIPLTTLSNQ